MQSSTLRQGRISLILSVFALAAMACVCTGLLPGGGDAAPADAVDPGSDAPAFDPGPPPPCIIRPEEITERLGVGVADQTEQNETRCRNELDNDSTLLVDVIDEGSPEAAQEDYLDWYDNNTDEDSDASLVVIINGLGDAAFFNTGAGMLSGYTGQYQFLAHYVGPNAADQQAALTSIAALMVARLGGDVDPSLLTGGAAPGPDAAGDAPSGEVSSGDSSSDDSSSGSFSGASSDAPMGPADVPMPSGPQVNVNFVNTSGYELCHFYVTPAAAPDWGTDYGVGLPIGDQTTYGPIETFAAGIYDIKVEDCDFNIIAWNLQIDIPDIGTIEAPIEPLQHAVTLLNDLDDAICAVHLTRIEDFGDQGWRRNLLGDSESIAAGATLLFKIGDGNWNIRLDTCGGETLEGIGLSLSGLLDRNASDLR